MIAQAMTVDDLRRRMVEPANGDAAHVARGRLIEAVLLLGVGDLEVYVSLREGRAIGLEPGPKPLRASDLSIRAAPDVWRTFWQPMPPPGFHDILALAKAGRVTVEGDIRILMTHLRFLKDLLAFPRRHPGGVGG